MSLFLVLNPGSTSTKVAVYEDLQLRCSGTIRHTAQELGSFTSVISQRTFRLDTIMTYLQEQGYDGSEFDAVIAIGGLLKKVSSGAYRVNDAMLQDLEQQKYGEHAANLGAILAQDFAGRFHIPAYVGDPITVDEMQPIARMSGHPLLPRYGRTHTLNHKRIAYSVSTELGKEYQDCRLIIAHLGGGISIGAHAGGQIIDSTSSRGEGAFSMDRSGQLNSWELAKLCFSGKYDKKTVLKMLNGEGGVWAYLGTKDFRQVEELMDQGNELASQVFHALVYQVAKEIGAMAVVLQGRFDAIVLTGGIVFSKKFVAELTDYIGFLGKIVLRPGEEEMESLCFYLHAITQGTMEPKEYC